MARKEKLSECGDEPVYDTENGTEEDYGDGKL